MRKTLRQRLGYALALCLIASGFSALAAAPAGARDTDTCTGSLNDFPAHVGVLSGIHAGNVQINGACVVNAGPTEVKGNLTVLPGSALLAAFGETNFEPGSPASTLTVDGSVSVQSGGTLLLGCFATSFPCFLDPMAGPDHSPTLITPPPPPSSLTLPRTVPS